ncbi:MAG TPA: hypothetical protein VFX16_36310 [Pseudonocardiaceae bacterium]|nr:hypothetical protein [Pseudonocardiaceae bacterium]
MGLIEGVGRMAVGVGTVLLHGVGSTNTVGAGREGVGPSRRASWPTTPPGATSECMAGDGEGTMYAPTTLGLDASAAIADGCPMEFAVEKEGTFLSLGGANAGVGLLFTDQALLDFTKLAMRASRKMLRVRGEPTPAWLGNNLC